MKDSRDFDEAETVQLTHRLHVFFNLLDERRYDELADLFIPQGRWLRQGHWLDGRGAILEALRGRPASMRVRHVISNVIVGRRSDAEKEVQAYLTAYRQSEHQLPSLFSLNVVRCIYRREDHAWLLAEQQLVREFVFAA